MGEKEPEEEENDFLEGVEEGLKKYYGDAMKQFPQPKIDINPKAALIITIVFLLFLMDLALLAVLLIKMIFGF